MQNQSANIQLANELISKISFCHQQSKFSEMLLLSPPYFVRGFRMNSFMLSLLTIPSMKTAIPVFPPVLNSLITMSPFNSARKLS